MKKYPCPSCNQLTLSEQPPGTFEICSVCGWEDDDLDGGANEFTLEQAKKNVQLYGVANPSRAPQPKK